MNAPTPIVDRRRASRREAQQRRRDRLEVARVGEEGEDLLGRAGQDAARARGCGCASSIGYAMSDLRQRTAARRCAPTTTSAAPDGRAARRSSTRDFTCPRCALAASGSRPTPVRVAFRHFALQAQAPARRPARPRRRGGRAPGRVLGDPRRALRRPGPHRRPAPLGALRSARASISTASRPTAATRRSPSGSRATCATALRGRGRRRRRRSSRR